MNSDDRKRIQANYDKLVNNLRVNGVCDHLFAADVIDDEELEEITQLPKTRKDRVRTLLRILMKKSDPDVLDKFCRALVEADPVYQYLADAIRDCDVTSVEEADVVDSRNNPVIKQEVLVDTVLRQSNELIKMKADYEQQIAELKERNEILEQRQACLVTLKNSGFTDKTLLEFVDIFVFTSTMNGRSEKSTNHDILRKIFPESLTQDRLKACWLSIHIVQHVVTGKCQFELPASFQSYTTKLSTIVDTEMERHGDLFSSGMQNLHILEINGLNTFNAVADELFLGGECNWGRVIMWFTFCASLAKKFPGATSLETLNLYAIFSWYYIDSRMCDWIQNAGGWDKFLEFLIPSWPVGKFVHCVIDWLLAAYRYIP